MLWLQPGCVPDDPTPEPEPLLTLYADADRDGFGDASAPALAAGEGRGLVADATDCDDGDAAVYPGAAEACDEVDDDCDGLVDEDVQITVYLDADLDGWGDPDGPAQRCTASAGWAMSGADCDDSDAGRHPGVAEACNEVDDDCDGVVDDGVEEAFYRDADGDGYGDPRAEDGACAPSAGWVTNATDCDDASATTHPGASETTNDGIDQDCDGRDLADYAGTLYFASGFDRTPEVECERAYTTHLTPSSSMCPDCEFAFDVAYTFDPSASYDAGGCLDWGPPAEDFQRTLGFDLDAAAVWAYDGAWEVTPYFGYTSGGTLNYWLGVSAAPVLREIYHPNTDPYCSYHCWGWTEYVYYYYTAWLEFRAGVP